MNRIRGLDAIRFFCAVWVVVGHMELPIPFGHQAASLSMRFLYAALHSTVFGVAAVMVFFVISGFCIHFPFRHGEKPNWVEYFLRRYIRIGIPLVGALLLTWIIKGDTQPVQWVIWSLYAEIIYYTVYPLLMIVKSRISWQGLFSLSAVCTFVTVILNFQVAGMVDLNVSIAWLVGLPVWLMGCYLAEQADTLTAQKVPSIWAWRIGVWLGSCICGILRFHSPIGFPCTLPIFSILIFFWLRQEIRHFRFQAPPAFLEKAGAWSYSLYLMHNFAAWGFTQLHLNLPGIILPWLLKIASALLLAYLFFLLVERPSHWLARQVKRKPRIPIRAAEVEGGPKEPRGTELPEIVAAQSKSNIG